MENSSLFRKDYDSGGCISKSNCVILTKRNIDIFSLKYSKAFMLNESTIKKITYCILYFIHACIEGNVSHL